MHLPPPPPRSPHPLLPCVLNLRFQSLFLPPPAISTSPPSLSFQSAISIILPPVPTSPLRFQSANSIPLPLYTLLFPSSPPMRFESGVSINPRPSNPVPPSSPRDLREEGSSGTIGTSHMRSDTRAAITMNPDRPDARTLFPGHIAGENTHAPEAKADAQRPRPRRGRR